MGKVASFAKKGIQYALPIAKLLSLNDDEWFSKFKTSGATFAEPLTHDEIKDNTYLDAGEDENPLVRVTCVPALTQIATDFNVKYGDKTTSFDTSIMPSVLAYVRNKTNNVLVETTDAYRDALTATIQLYAIYYTLRKYEKLTLNIPLNAPTLPLGINALAPETYSQACGIADALEGYLKTTVGAPYHILAYVRWRYGTIFKSDNTGRPGLVVYDPFASRTFSYRNYLKTETSEFGSKDPLITWIHNEYDTEDYITSLKKAIGELQTRIMNCGRASADLHTAYKDHQVDYTVNDSLYDAKEYNLRCNLTSPVKMASGYDKMKLVLDSRLDQNAALQAVTCSVSKNMENGEPSRPLGTGGCQYQQGALLGSNYYQTNMMVKFPTIGLAQAQTGQYFEINAPFVVSDVTFVVNENANQTWNIPLIHCSDTSANVNTYLPLAGTKNGWSWLSIWASRVYLVRDDKTAATTVGCHYHIEKKAPDMMNAFEFKADGYISNTNGQNIAFWKTFETRDPISDLSHTLIMAVDACVIAVQMHNQTIAGDIWYDRKTTTTYVWDNNSLAYDTAVINNSQIASIQNMFMRNLFDGEIAMKQREALDEAKEDVVDLAKVTV